MSVVTGQIVARPFTLRRQDTGVQSNADSLPTGTLVINGVNNGAAVTITNVSTGWYKFSVVMPTLAIGDQVEMVITATVNAVTDNGGVWSDMCDMALDASGNVTVGTIASAAVLSIWNALTSTLTTVGSVGKRIADNLDAQSSAIKAKTDLIATNSMDSPNEVTCQTNVSGLRTDYTTARAAKVDNLDATISGVPAAVQASTVDGGLTQLQVMRALIAVMFGKAVVSGTTVQYLRRDGSTVAMTITFDTSGNRTVSTTGTL
jgi:hypothetical protein